MTSPLPSLVGGAVLILFLSCCSGPESSARDDTGPRELPGLSNVVRYADGVYSGSAPAGDRGFASLNELGVRTIVSVDGADPDVDRALAHGIRYVHLPIGYDSIPAQRTIELAAVLDDLPKPVYIHCHHGRHRGPAAAAAGCVVAGVLTPEEAVARMRLSGASEEYDGLYASVRSAKPVPAAAREVRAELLPWTNKVSGTAATMARIDDAIDELSAVRAAGWAVPSDHPDLDPSASAGRVRALLFSLAKDQETARRPPEFHEFLHQTATAAEALEQAIAAGNPAANEKAFESLRASCKQCHRRFRNHREER
ncbi:MAG: hypothetical protein Fur0037_13600 [Planctomycetota bacterium]